MDTLSRQSNTNEQQNYELEFFGIGSEYFKIIIVNWLLTIVTLGFYYPWAKAKRLRYVYGQTALNGERFHFSGTGKEIFRGFIKVVLFFVVIIAVYILITKLLNLPVLAIIFIYVAIFAIIPIAIHGSLRYRMSRTSYRGIRFGYRGDRNELIKRFAKGVFLTIITFGIYGAWFEMSLRRYIHRNIRYGDIDFSYSGEGVDFFLLNLKDYFLTLITLGIYSFWWQRDLFNYYIDNLHMTKDNKKVNFYSTATAGGFFSLLFINLLIVVFTLGFGKAWADMRTQKFICDNIKMEGDINLEEVHQTEEEYKDAFGEDAMDFFDIDLA